MANILSFARLAIETEYFITEELLGRENVKATEIKLNLSGKVINASRIMKKYHNIQIHGCIGNDSNGKLALDYLTKFGFKTDNIIASTNSQTGQIALINQHNGQHTSIHHYGANEDVLEYIKLDNEEIFKDISLIYTDTALPPLFLTKLLNIAKQKNIPVALDAPKRNDELNLQDISSCEYFMPNRAEASLYSGLPTTTKEDVEYAIKKLREIFKGNLIVTLDKEGCAYLERDKSEVKFVPSTYIPTKVEDTTGAGDIFRGTLISDLLLNKTMEESVNNALTLSSKSTEIRGVNESIERVMDIYQ